MKYQVSFNTLSSYSWLVGALEFLGRSYRMTLVVDYFHTTWKELRVHTSSSDFPSIWLLSFIQAIVILSIQYTIGISRFTSCGREPAKFMDVELM